MAGILGLRGNVKAEGCDRLVGHVSGSLFNVTRFEKALSVGEHHMRSLRLDSASTEQRTNHTKLITSISPGDLKCVQHMA